MTVADKQGHPKDDVNDVSCPVVDVIVPVYSGEDETRRCLASLQAAVCRMPFEIVVVDDCSPSADLSAWLEAEAGAGRITLLRNETNRGFVASVNRGMALHPTRDVVLLNSDTEVANDWLDRMVACARRAPDVGTITPFSNNATICSYPFEGWAGEVPGALGLAGLDALFARVNGGRTEDLPSAVGFCLFIRRACLEVVGAFDEARFGRGYGEENDFSRRVLAAGWRNVLCGDVFVYHRGGVSFGEERVALMARAGDALRAAHPDYDEVVKAFIARDPIAPLRRAVDTARAALGGNEFAAVMTERVQELDFRRSAGRTPRSPLPVQLHITHKWGGGIERWVQDFCAADLSRRNLVLRGRTSRNDTAFQLELVDPQLGQTPLRTWDLVEPIGGTAIGHAEYREILAWIRDTFGVQTVIISSLIGHALEVFDSGLPTVMVLHDFYPFCPALFAFFDRPCTRCDKQELGRCLASNPHNIFWHVTDAERWSGVRDAFAARLQSADVTVAAPSRGVYDRYLSLFPPLASRPWRLVAHGLGGALIGQLVPRAAAETSRRLRILLPGRLLPHKGMWLLHEAYDALHEFADLILLGSGDFGQPFEGRPGVTVVRDYDIDALPTLVASLQPDCALLLSVLPESFSYTLSEMNALGLPTVATRLGAFAERIRDGENGFLVAPEVAAVVARMRALADDRGALQRVAENLCHAPVRTAFDMVMDYESLVPLGRGESGFGASAEGLLHLLAERIRMGGDLALAKEKAALLQADVHAHSVLVRDREARLQELERQFEAQAVRLHECELNLLRAESERDGLRASMSWRVTRPLRAVSRALSRGGAEGESGNGGAVAPSVAPAVAAVVDAAVTAPVPVDDTDDLAARASTAAPPADDVVAEAAVVEAATPPMTVSAARHWVRERLGMPDAAVVVAGGGTDEQSELDRFVELAGRVTQGNTRVSFVWLGKLNGTGSHVQAARLLVETRDLFFVDDGNPAAWLPGMDIYCASADAEADELLATAAAAGLEVVSMADGRPDPERVEDALRKLRGARQG